MFYGWRMVGLVTALRVLGGGLHNYGFTVFFLPLSHDLGLSRAATSLAFSLARAEGALEGPFVGYLIDRFGPRPMLLLATVMCGAGYILLAWVDSYTTFLIVYLGVISLSFTPGFVHASMAVGNTWFIRYRARAMTVISSAVPIGGALLTPLLAIAVQSWGWRWGAILAGTLFLCLGIPLALGVRSSPESMGLLPDGDAPRQSSAHGDSGKNGSPKKSADTDPTLREAMKTMVFWLFVIGMTVRVAAYSTISVHFIPIMVWKGLSQEHAAFLLGALCFSQLGGALRRRPDRRRCQPAQALGGVHARRHVFRGSAHSQRCALGALVVYHSFHRDRRVVSHRLGDHRRLLRTQILRHHPRHHGLFLHVGRRHWTGHRRRSVRPEPKLHRDLVGNQRPAPARRAAHRVAGQTLERRAG